MISTPAQIEDFSCPHKGDRTICRKCIRKQENPKLYEVIGYKLSDPKHILHYFDGVFEKGKKKDIVIGSTEPEQQVISFS